jgi:PAS domain S-box-containing protein
MGPTDELNVAGAGLGDHLGLPESARRALAESEDRYRRATSAGRVGVWDWDIPSNRVTWCPTTHELHGVPLGDFDGQLDSFTSLIHPDDHDRVGAAIQAALAAGTGFEATFRVLRREDGVQRWLWTRAETYLGPTGVPIRMTGATADVTDRLSIEEALRASELRLRLALETVPLSIYYLAPSLVITEVVNPPKGMTASDYVGRTDQEVYGVEAARPLVALKKRVLQSRVPSREEIWLPILGQPRCFVMSVEPNYAPNGDLLGLVDAAYDITELKKAEAEIQRTSAILDTINKTTPTLIYMKDLESRLIFANPATQDVVRKMRTEDRLGEPDNAHVADGYREAITRNDRHVITTGETLTVEEVVPSPDGPVVLISTKSPYFNDRGDVIGIIGVSTDITERKRTENAIKESESRFRNMADAAPVMIWVCDANQQSTYFNATWLNFTGRTMDQELGAGWIQSVHPDDLDRCLATLSEAFKLRKPVSAEYRIRRYDGVYRWILDRGTPRFDSEGGLIGYVGSCIDVTDSRAAMESMRQADRRKDEFLAVLAHELRNPLAPINSSTEYLKLRGGIDDEAKWALDIIGNQVSHLSRLVDDLLDVARITQNRIELRREVITLSDVAYAAIETCRPAIAAAGHTFQVELDPEPIYIDADFARVNQVLQNLLLNACKYTPEAGLITLRTFRQNGRAVAEVSDTGIGLSSDHMEAIFDLFVQADHSSTRAQSGLGIGLTLVQRLMEMHGGSVHASSPGLGQGSTFTIDLPAASPPGAISSETEMNDSSATMRKSILIVDDNRDAADVLGKMIEFLGNNVRVVYSGQDALSVVREFQPDVVFMDLGMPDMDGYEAARRISASGDVPNATLVALTGWGQDEAKEKTREAGFHHHLVKPVSLATLSEILKG